MRESSLTLALLSVDGDLVKGLIIFVLLIEVLLWSGLGLHGLNLLVIRSLSLFLLLRALGDTSINLSMTAFQV